MTVEMVNAKTFLSGLSPEIKKEVQPGFDQLLQSVMKTQDLTSIEESGNNESLSSVLEPVLGTLTSPLPLVGQVEQEDAEFLADTDSEVMEQLSLPLGAPLEGEGALETEPEDLLSLFEEFRQSGEFDPQRVMDYLGVRSILTWTSNNDMA
ncbi:hypothetical protein [Dethiosulfatarculus sandiegensis]|uniref:Uncharacterized protein n=1 Tax=Dethiosulfatarculus sandiegensis TaxID=1429043 RepID=A0A0D2JP20_9BACT|nr:hypothetical protein [Dethiosulfatarculus sandiegensis]KIX11240.1 hypothetical protein X474_25740 [Dethiosulfatarculus sandiegensis]